MPAFAELSRTIFYSHTLFSRHTHMHMHTLIHTHFHYTYTHANLYFFWEKLCYTYGNILVIYCCIKKLPQNVSNLKQQTVSHEVSTGQESRRQLAEWFWFKVSRGLIRVQTVTWSCTLLKALFPACSYDWWPASAPCWLLARGSSSWTTP